jgi:hypothetical protein
VSREAWERTAILACLGAALAASLSVASIGWFHAISDSHGWRQTETAIRAHFIAQGGPWLSYETPVLGPPWQMPHEFPAYQLLVAGLVNLTGMGLEQAGRAVSLGLFYAAAMLVYVLLGDLGVAPRHRLLVVALWLVSPLYLFWSRTFMIESTALALSLAFLTFGLRFFLRGRSSDALITLVFGSLSFAVKPPTFVPFAVLAAFGWGALTLRAHFRPNARVIVGSLLLILPIAVGRVWHEHADALKLLNPFGWGWTSDAMWRDWVLGPPGTHAGPELRLSQDAWRVLLARTIPESVGHYGVAVAGVCGALLARRRLILISLSVAALLLHFVAFTPLHLSHPYYQYAMGLFLVGAVGLSAVALLEVGGRRKWWAWLIVALMGLACGHTYMERMLPVQRQNAYRRAWFTRLASAVAERTRPTDVIVVLGLDWNPEVPYYARRRALMWPGWGDLSVDGKDVAAALAHLGNWPVGALLRCSEEIPPETVSTFIRRLGLDEAAAFEMPAVGGGRVCAVHLRAEAAQGVSGTGP